MKAFFTLVALVLFGAASAAQAQTTTPAPASAEVSTSTDFFVMPGTDFDRPGLKERANLNIGIGHSFNFLNKDPLGNEVTFAYTYENAGSTGWWHSQYGSHTEALGIMRNFNLTKKTFGFRMALHRSPAARPSRIAITMVRL